MSAPSARTRARVLARVVVLCGGALVALAAPVSAAWLTGATASSSFTTTSLAAPTGLTATQSCLATTRSVDLSWTPTASTFATGYKVFRKTGAGSFVELVVLSDRTTSGYVDTPLASSTTYTYYVQTTYQSWTAPSGQASATTQGALCVL
ncbi:MAG: hypothetical protein Q8R60_11475 [Mycobacteriales bacterium]|nr:hypothetical protein [Mycobacteriales bacterium]